MFVLWYVLSGRIRLADILDVSLSNIMNVIFNLPFCQWGVVQWFFLEYGFRRSSCSPFSLLLSSMGNYIDNFFRSL